MSVFLAVDLDASTRTRVWSLIRRWSTTLSATWLTEEKLHLTMCFFGEPDQAARERLTKVLAPVLGEAAPFTLELAGAGRFETRRAPLVLWLGVAGEVERARALRAACETALAQPSDRPWVPHVTLARVHQPTSLADQALADLQMVRGWAFEVAHLTLYESYQGASTALARFPLKGARVA